MVMNLKKQEEAPEVCERKQKKLTFREERVSGALCATNVPRKRRLLAQRNFLLRTSSPFKKPHDLKYLL